MLLTDYLTHHIISKTIKFSLLATAVISVIEALDALVLMPVSISTSHKLMLWVLTWPLVLAFVLPLSFFAGLLTTLVGFAQSQELIILQMSLRPSQWLRALSTPVLSLTALLVLATGWIVPGCFSLKNNLLAHLLHQVQLPKTVAGQFNHIEVGNKKIVLFESKKKGTPIFVATNIGDSDQTTIMAVKGIDISRISNMPVLSLTDGESYTFHENNALQQKLKFKLTQIPLDFKVKNNDTKKLLMSNNALIKDADQKSLFELSWRVHQSCAVIILGLVAMLLGDYLTCRHRPIVVYWLGGLVSIGYYLVQFLIKNKAMGLVSIFQVNALFTLGHILFVLIGFVLKKTRLLGLKY